MPKIVLERLDLSNYTQRGALWILPRKSAKRSVGRSTSTSTDSGYEALSDDSEKPQADCCPEIAKSDNPDDASKNKVCILNVLEELRFVHGVPVWLGAE